MYAPPRPGFLVGGAIGFGFGITIGTWFRPWGWGGTRFGWDSHAIFINDHRWVRSWANRRVYVHDYPDVHRYAGPEHVEHHDLIRRSPAEREAPRRGHEVHEEHYHH